MPKKALLIAALFTLIVWIPRQAFALTITPIRYEISGTPGEVISETITLVNETSTPELYYVSFANFEAQGDSGSPTFVDPKDDLGSWMTTEQASVALNPGQQKTIPFHIHIPKDAEPGGHFAALFWGTTTSAAPGQVSVGSKTGALVLLSVKGDVKEQGGLLDFSLRNNVHFYRSLPIGFQYRFSNQGGDRVKPSGHVIIRSIFGWRVKKLSANPFDGNVLPGTTRKFSPEWAKRDSIDSKGTQNEPYSFIRNVKNEWHNFALGVFRARLDVVFGSQAQHIKSNAVYVVVFPWELLLVCIIGIVPLFYLLRALIRRYNRAIIKKAQARFQERRDL